MKRGKTILELLAASLLYSLIVILVDLVIVFFFVGDINQITSPLSLVVLFEGGIALTVGGGVAVYSPLGAKISEIFFRSKPWNAKRLKEVENQARVWIATGAVLVFIALLLSAV
jgi:hypothetical protein